MFRNNLLIDRLNDPLRQAGYCRRLGAGVGSIVVQPTRISGKQTRMIEMSEWQSSVSRLALEAVIVHHNVANQINQRPDTEEASDRQNAGDGLKRFVQVKFIGPQSAQKEDEENSCGLAFHDTRSMVIDWHGSVSTVSVQTPS
jgi:hypothetical protein